MEGVIDYYLKNRLKELEIEKHHFDWQKVEVDAGKIKIIEATNDYLYLYDVSPKNSFQIESDIEIITDEIFFSDGAPYRLFEFKGDVVIRNNSDEIQSYSFFVIKPENN